MKWSKALTLISFAVMGSTQVLDLGDLNQYQAKLTKAPAISGNTMWLSGKDGDGYDIALSEDAITKINNQLQSCKIADDKCYQGVHEAIRSLDIQIDGQLDRRGFLSLLSKTFKKGISVFEFIATWLMAVWIIRKHQVNQLGLHVPQNKAGDAAVFATATKVTVSAEGSAVATITPTPDPTKLQGSHTPYVTSMAQAGNGFNKGDLAAIIDKDLASRIDEVMQRMKDCADGQKFDQENGSKSRIRATGTYGEAICGAESVATMAMPGGPLNDLLLLDPARLAFGFANPSSIVAKAAAVVTDFVIDSAPLLSIELNHAEQLGHFIFGLAIDAIVQDVPLAETNVIKASLVTIGAPKASATSTAACPKSTDKALLCGFTDISDCDVKLPSKTGSGVQYPVCSSGKYQGCKCQTPRVMFVQTISKAQVQAISSLFGQPEKNPATKPMPQAICDRNTFTEIPARLFSSDQSNVYQSFCEGWSKDKASSSYTNSYGLPYDTLPKSGGKQLQPDPGQYLTWGFGEDFTPTPGGGDCALNCTAAMKSLSEQCANTVSPFMMAIGGSVDVGCGKFTYNVSVPVPMTQLGTQNCYDRNDFGDIGNGVSDDTLQFFASLACAPTSSMILDRAQPSSFLHYARGTKAGKVLLSYKFDITWKDQCQLQTGSNQMFPGNPLAEYDPTTHTCYNLFYNNWKGCTNNAGRGGNIQAGCLVYDFKPQVLGPA